MRANVARMRKPPHAFACGGRAYRAAPWRGVGLLGSGAVALDLVKTGFQAVETLGFQLGDPLE